MNIVIFAIFALVSILIIGSAVMVVVARNVIHSALWLIASFFGVGALYLLLEAEFAAMIQVLVYVGAVSILMLFAIMLTRHVTGQSEHQYYSRWWLSLGVSALLFGAVLVPTLAGQRWAPPQTPPAGEAIPGQPTGIAGAQEIGQAFMREYLIPFEVTSVLLLVALVGAIVVAYEERARRRRVLTLAEEHALRQREADAARPKVEAAADEEPVEESAEA
jgi:NADH-quinone oxidoreductase subunit J